MSEEQANNQMDIWAHVGELRARILRSLIALILTTAISFAFSETLIRFLARPIGGLDRLLAIEVTENISVFMKVSLLSGFIAALPFILYQLLAFIIPGLKKHERRWIYYSIPVATILFLAGVAFAQFVMLPTAIPFLVGFLGTPTTPRLTSYISFVTNLLFWIGASFEAPLVVFVLAKLNLVNAKGLAKHWRIAIVIIAILSAVISPTVDPVNMGLLMLPLFCLYLLSILFAVIARRQKKTD